MRRIHTALLFWAFVAGSMVVPATRACAADLSLIGYDERGVQQSQDDAQAQPCQSCPPGAACQTCPTSAACAGNSDEQAHCVGAGPMILSIGPPPRLYSPSADFGTRTATTPSNCIVVGDEKSGPNPRDGVAKPNPVCALGYPVYPAHDPATVGHLLESGVLGMGFENTMVGPPPLPVMAAPQFVPNVVYQTCAPVTYFPPAPAYLPAVIANAHPLAGEADRLDHMLQAIHHLQAAGLQAEADQLRGRCDAAMHEVVSQLKTAETQMAQLHQAVNSAPTAAMNLPQHPVVTSALPPSRNTNEHSYSVQQVGYLTPVDSSARSSNTFDERPLPAPFVPQPITIEPINVFGEPGEGWDTKPEQSSGPIESSRPFESETSRPWWDGFHQ
jgi:hypothetical protein